MSELEELTDNNFNEEIKKNDRVVVVDFYADWCRPCKVLDSFLEELDKEYVDKVKIFRINVETSLNTVNNFEITGVPSILIFKSGELITKNVGLRTKKDLKVEIDRIYKE